MEDFGIRLHPVKKIQLWRAVKKEIFEKMERDIITPEQADSILGDMKQKISKINTPAEAKEFYLNISYMYAELGSIAHKFKMEELEALDSALILFLDEIMIKGEFDLASSLMDQIEQNKDHNALALELQKKYPIEFQLCLKKFSQKFS